MQRFAVITKLIIGIPLFAGLSLADYALDFNISAPNSGTISYAGGNNPLKGSGISINNVVAPAGDTLSCDSCFFNFTTGGLESYADLPFFSDWNFGAGGSLSLTGSLTYKGQTVSGTLFSGYFDDASVVGIGNTFKVAIADFLTPSAAIASLFGVPLTEGNFNISFSALLNGQAFTSSQLGSGDVFAGAPEPASIVLLGTVLLGCATLVRRRRA
jgi:hypothetical protein